MDIVLFSLLLVATLTNADEYDLRCEGGKVLRTDGVCVFPKVYQHLFVYDAPALPEVPAPPPQIPTPEIMTNIVFIRGPEPVQEPDPIIVAPPRNENVVYVLNKQRAPEGPKVIEVPAPPPKTPKVYFLHYDDDNIPVLPGGADFQDALASAIGSGSSPGITGASGAFGGGGGGGGISVVGDGTGSIGPYYISPYVNH
ncbi:uncharacterized protein LOC121864299 isoform X1 [Homarus americanus]|uniref:uncharacterized protein LOC121864299 isoform X1 n=1 Tax=Homarus americanus TaxID=6706 RepID=UPI001C457EF3|nr:uncharacterized protein LOC121864299 isoform X1 [Homarus americanus]